MRRIPFEIGLIALALVVNFYAVFLPANSLVMGWFGSDDAFYYFKTAQNIAEGHGITFDQLGRDSGFHPLWMLVITPIFTLARYDRILPLRLVVLLSALLNAATGVVLYRLSRRFLMPFAAALIALFWTFYPFIHSQVTEMGMESGISAFFIALLIYQVAKQEPARDDDDGNFPISGGLRQALWIGAIATLTVFARLDNIFIVLLVGAWLAIRPARMRYLLLSDVALIILGVLWSYMTRVGFGPTYAQSAASAYWMVVVALAVRVALYYLFGLYGSQKLTGSFWLPWQLVKAAAVSLLSTALITVTMLALQALHVFPGFPRLVLAYEAGCALAAVLAVRLIAAFLTRGNIPAGEPLRWRTTILRLAGYFGPVGLALVVYMGASLWYFGTPMPVSGQIKRWWGTLPNPIYGRPVETLGGMLGFFPRSTPWSLAQALISWPAALPEWLRLLIYGGIALFILLALWQRTRKAVHALAIFPLFAGSFVQLISYTGTGYLHMRGWYWVSDMMAITLLVGILADDLLCRAQGLTFHAVSVYRIGNALVAAICALVVFYGVSDLVRRMPMVLSQRMTGYYMEGINELKQNTEPGSVIGSTGGGVVAYFIDGRTIVNLDGLMNTAAYFRALQQGTASQYLDKIGLKYIYAGENAITSSDPYFQFKGRLEKLKEFGGSTLFLWKK